MSQRSLRVLIADDQPSVAAVIRFSLERLSYEVSVAKDGNEAWQLLEQSSFDLVILDQQMPHLSGSQICQLMRQHRQHQHTAIFMLTGKGFELDLPQLEEELGVTLIMSKPFSPQALTEAVQEHFARCRGQSAALNCL